MTGYVKLATWAPRVSDDPLSGHSPSDDQHEIFKMVVSVAFFYDKILREFSEKVKSGIPTITGLQGLKETVRGDRYDTLHPSNHHN